MRQYYYLSPQNEQVGPVDGSQLTAYGVTATTMVWTQGMPQWVPANTVDELRPYFPPTTSVPPPAAAPVPQSVTYIQTGPAYPQQPMMPKPNNHMVMAVLATIFCCLPTGIIAIIYASKVDGLYVAGNYAEAQSKANSARNWSIISAVGAVIGSIIYVLFYAGALATAIGTSGIDFNNL